jgi:hypothetical protein
MKKILLTAIISQINDFPVLWTCYTVLFLACVIFYQFSLRHGMNQLTAK